MSKGGKNGARRLCTGHPPGSCVDDEVQTARDETLDADMQRTSPSKRPKLASLMATVSGVGALLALSLAVAPVPADRFWTFFYFSIDVLLPGFLVWACRRVAVIELLLQFSLTSWLLFLIGLVSPTHMPTIPLTVGLAIACLITTSIIIRWIGKVHRPIQSKHTRWWLLLRAASWNLLGTGLILMPSAVIFVILRLNSVE
jgi:hypothetical protein